MSASPNILRPEVLEDGNKRRDQAEPNLEEEGQPVEPDEINGVEESEEDAP